MQSALNGMDFCPALPWCERAQENFCAVARKYRRAVSFLYGDGECPS